ncbi:MAG: DegT/DnrJ/EryC1/StrS family aminotransferase [Marinilabiliales bacterium]|nr:MAG: DegT/DnrJ/EryC1/StrS family aminotransferase [Marinilabiliales bacterium]
MWKKSYSRREFIKKNSLTGLGAVLAMSSATAASSFVSGDAGTPAIIGGSPVRTAGWPVWPFWDTAADEKFVVDVLRKGVWCRAGVDPRVSVVSEFERQYAEKLGSKRCLAVVNGTNSLIIALRMLDIGGGDEVIVTPYTFIATISAILEVGAMPVFADVDPATFQIRPENIKKKITPATRAILPVHILGLPCDMPAIMDIAREHDLIVVEDACQAWLAEINNRKVGTFGHAGCFSFQNTKHLAIGEGGALISDDDQFMDRCYSYHDTGSRYGRMDDLVGGIYVMRGNNLRMTEYQAAIGLAQMKRLDEQTTVRNINAAYLKPRLSDIPGIMPYELYDHVTRAAFHLFAFRYKKEEFSGMTRPEFLRALRAEGVPCSGGYSGNLNMMPYLDEAFKSKNYRNMYPAGDLNFERFVEANRCPESERLCNEEAVWLFQSMLLGEPEDMDDIFNAIEKIHRNSGKIKASLQEQSDNLSL